MERISADNLFVTVLGIWNFGWMCHRPNGVPLFLCFKSQQCQCRKEDSLSHTEILASLPDRYRVRLLIQCKIFPKQ